MKAILTINHDHFILPDSANVNLILKTLSACVEVRPNYEVNELFQVQADAVRVSVKMVDAKRIIPLRTPKAIAQKAGPDANGKEFFKPE